MSLQPGDVFTTADGRELLVQYTEEVDEGLAIYGRWVAEDGSVDALATHLITETCEWFVNNATVPSWCCNRHMYDGTGDFPATGEHPDECPFADAEEEEGDG